MINVYWSPWYRQSNLYVDNYLNYPELDSAYLDLVKGKDNSNHADNFFNCYAFKSAVKNMYCLRNPYDVDFIYERGQCRSKTPPKTGIDLSVTSQIKSPSVKESSTINYCVNWIFFADKPLQIQTLHPWMHNTEMSKTAYYVPGQYDISSWFRPVEGAFQLFPGKNTFTSKENEPLIYVNFLTDEKINLQKFYLTPSLIEHSISCTHLKHYKKFTALNSLYKTFHKSKLRNRVLTEIKQNLLEDK
jgi:hypothetical protein